VADHRAGPEFLEIAPHRFMKTKWILITLIALTLAVIAGITFVKTAAISTSSVAVTQTFQVRGEIRELDPEQKFIRIAHEEIPDYMPAMTMPLPVKDTALFEGLSAGDSVQFELSVTEDDSWISHIRKIAPDNPLASTKLPTSKDFALKNQTERVLPGESFPDFELLDQDGKVIRLSDYRGKAVVLTFIYTRCPLPNFCPLMSKNFADLEQRMNKQFPGRYQLLSITMDPEFDRPEVLKQYAIFYGANTRNWSFATGDSAQIQFVAELSGLTYAWENGVISHDLRTLLIGPDGRLKQVWKSNVWTPYEIQRSVAELFSPEKSRLSALAHQ
jgi:protein SCO1/2